MPCMRSTHANEPNRMLSAFQLKKGSLPPPPTARTECIRLELSLSLVPGRGNLWGPGSREAPSHGPSRIRVRPWGAWVTGGGGGDSRAGEGPVMSAKGHRKGAGKAASVVSIAGSEANGTTFEGLYRAYYRALVSYAGKLVGPHNAEDVVQEAFRSCWEEIDGEGIPGDIVARLRRRTSLRSLDLRRKLSHWESWDPAAFEAVALGLAPDALRKRELLEELIERVPEPELKRLIGHLWIGLTHAEIAEVERLSKRTVKRRWAALKKEMRALKKMIGPFRTSETTIRVST
jgi:RNA polymerase sigma factor (sigma-70 family)